MIDHEVLDAFWTALGRLDVHPRALEQISEVVRLAVVEDQLRETAPERLARITALAERALGREEAAWWWLRSTPGTLAGVPLDLLAEGEDGARSVEHALGMIEGGVFG